MAVDSVVISAEGGPPRLRLAGRIRPALDALGGPDAVTWPAFWVSLATILLGNLTSGGSIPLPWPERLALLVIAHLVMFAPLVLLRLTLLKDPGRPRPIVGIAALVGAPILRGFAFAGMLAWAAPGQDPNLAFRIASGASGLTTVLIITALAVHGLREHRRRLQRLLDLREDLLRAQESAETIVEERNAAAVDRLRSILMAELDSVDRSGSDGAAESLERFANDIVRPLSHELALAIPTSPLDIDANLRPTITRGQVMSAILEGRPFRPFGTALLLAVLVLFTLVALYGPTVALTVLLAEIIAVPAILGLGNIVLARMPPGASRAPRLVVFITTPLIASLALGGAIVAAFASSIDVTLLVASAFVFVPLLAVPLALAKATRQRQDLLEAEILDSTVRLQRQVCRLHQMQWFQQKALSRALHGPVQSAVTAAVLTLRGRLGLDDAGLDQVARVREELLGSIDVLGSDSELTPSLDESLARITGLWASLCSIDVDIDTAARTSLESDPVVRSCIVDLVTEATSNAVRHGRATLITVSLASDSGDLRLIVVNNGDLSMAERAPGLGTRQLDDCSLFWSRTYDDDHYILAATIPAALPA